MVSGEEAFMEHIIGMRNLSHDIFQCGFSMTLALVYWTVTIMVVCCGDKMGYCNYVYMIGRIEPRMGVF